jgi:hypothetical protein
VLSHLFFFGPFHFDGLETKFLVLHVVIIAWSNDWTILSRMVHILDGFLAVSFHAILEYALSEKIQNLIPKSSNLI